MGYAEIELHLKFYIDQDKILQLNLFSNMFNWQEIGKKTVFSLRSFLFIFESFAFRELFKSSVFIS